MRILHVYLFSILLLLFSILLKMRILPQAPPASPKVVTMIILPQAPPASPKVTAYLLVVQWQPGVCTGNSTVKCQINPVPDEFKIQGLWPEPKGTASTETYDPQELTNITTQLNNHWPNLGSKQQQIVKKLVFWRHEWTDHGKYSEMGVHEYFEKTLELFKDVGEGLKGKLAAENITATIYKPYKLQAIEAALTKINGGFSCTVVCNERNTSKKEKQIQEIRFRYTKDFKMENNTTPSSTCVTATNDVMFPVMP